MIFWFLFKEKILKDLSSFTHLILHHRRYTDLHVFVRIQFDQWHFVIFAVVATVPHEIRPIIVIQFVEMTVVRIALLVHGRRLIESEIRLGLVLSIAIMENVQIVDDIVGYVGIVRVHLELVHVGQLSGDDIFIGRTTNG